VITNLTEILPMKDKVFLDSNLLVYYATEPIKQTLIVDILEQSYEVFISTQCLNEFVNVCLKKRFLSVEQTKLAIYSFGLLCDIYKPNENTIRKALDIHLRYQYSFYDSLIVATALECSCEVLYSEDMSNGQVIEGLQIVNPFVD
jgi:predicted nucleic acid-binding protein